MNHQLWGPLISLVGDGGYRAITVGGWFVMKYANIAAYLVVAVVFVTAMFLNLAADDGEQK